MNQAELLIYSREMIAKGSKSFAKAARLFKKDDRDIVTLFYAWCRHCDDVIDGQTYGLNAEMLTPEIRHERLQHLIEQTEKSLTGEGGDGPAFQALRQVVMQRDIPHYAVMDVLKGFKVDTDGTPIVSVDDLMLYCYYVAGAVGIVMAAIMGKNDKSVLQRACDLGLAFQLTNIARDVMDDAAIGRCYLPEEWLKENDVFDLRRRLVKMAEPYYQSARIGIAELPFRSAWAVSSALLIYRAIGQKVLKQKLEAEPMRLHTSAAEKTARVVQGLFLAVWVKYVSRHKPPRQALWTCAALTD